MRTPVPLSQNDVLLFVPRRDGDGASASFTPHDCRDTQHDVISITPIRYFDHAYSLRAATEWRERDCVMTSGAALTSIYAV
jgi:hypothetical protein